MFYQSVPHNVIFCFCCVLRMYIITVISLKISPVIINRCYNDCFYWSNGFRFTIFNHLKWRSKCV
ncbi:hypothetical protein MBAV_002820 [Candidatus Magnetobacterium bavaricum]|uniref:Uncharacterized protein n=1 Tax=Candidatus Magnetobacterium bavaricum TaxID=29290 RepID=A0A0F3GSS8_9BACT|nr:hypothetical protein MBAV_002820 [Candidatus Magnetobacterium bavaricum]